MKYSEKVENYSGDNVLAQALSQTAYHNNPQFLNNVANRYGFKAIPKFKKQSITDRAEIYLQMASDIWNPTDIKEIAGGWSDEEEKAFFKNTKGQEYTVSYAKRSWTDALKYGFLSANIDGTGRYLYNVQVGDIVFCHIAGNGFVGIGECTATAVPMMDFTVDVNGNQMPVALAPWDSEKAKANLEQKKEVFIGIKWKKYVANPADGYWEKGMTSVPLVAYSLTDKATYKMVKEHFGYADDAVE